jgi:hypothetical protein
MNDQQQLMFYEDGYDALTKGIAISGKPRKAIAMAIWPGKKEDQAQSMLTRALSPEGDVKLNLDNIEALLNEIDPIHFIHYLCDRHGFERPNRKDRKAFEKSITEKVDSLAKQFSIIVKEVKSLEKMK